MTTPAEAPSWQAWTSASTPWFSLAGVQGPARLLDVHDGDTLTLAAEVLPGCVRQFKVRVDGIDTPEVSSRDAAERAAGQRARLRLVQLLAPGADLGARDPSPTAAPLKRGEMQRALQGGGVHMVHVRCVGMDKYGRALAQVSRDAASPCVSDTLVGEGLARRYDGGTKQAWSFGENDDEAQK